MTSGFFSESRHVKAEGHETDTGQPPQLGRLGVHTSSGKRHPRYISTRMYMCMYQNGGVRQNGNAGEGVMIRSSLYLFFVSEQRKSKK